MPIDGHFGRIIRVAFGLACVVALAGCSSEGDDATSEPCQSGRSVACTCAGGAEGAQVCGEDGTWGPCDCNGDEGGADTGDEGMQTSDTGSTSGGTDSEVGPQRRDTSSDGDGDGGGSGPSGFSWDQTHVDTQWLYDADETDDITVETVTNLDPSGEGSLEAALSAAEDNANTLVVFEVGGVIDYGGDTFLRSRGENVYIAGQTAPYPGVTLVRGGLRIHGDNTIVQHMTFLPGDDVATPSKSRSITYDDEATHVIVDHCAAGWAPDTNVNFRNDHSNLALINSINSEPLNESSHPEAPHGYGTLMSENTTEITVMGNLMTHNWKRNPYNSQSDANFTWINNYVYNWGARHYHGTTSDGPEFDWIGNVSHEGPDTDLEEGIFEGNEATVYYEDNLLIPDDTPLEDDSLTYVDDPLNLPMGLAESDMIPPGDLEEFLVSTVGPRPADRAPFAERIVEDFVNRAGEIIDHHDDVGGYPDYETQTRELDPPETDVLDWLQQYTVEVEGS